MIIGRNRILIILFIFMSSCSNQGIQCIEIETLDLIKKELVAIDADYHLVSFFDILSRNNQINKKVIEKSDFNSYLISSKWNKNTTFIVKYRKNHYQRFTLNMELPDSSNLYSRITVNEISKQEFKNLFTDYTGQSNFNIYNIKKNNCIISLQLGNVSDWDIEYQM